jgi:hypothetical protein
MRMPSPVFDANEQNSFISHLAGARVKDGMSRVGPIFRGQNRIFGMSIE